MSRLRYAVILTHDRPEDFQDCVNAIVPQVDRLIVIGHLAPYAKAITLAVGGHYTDYTEPVPNISKAWNFGLAQAEIASHGLPYDVAVLNDDAIVAPDWFSAITEEMRAIGAAAGCAAQPPDPRMAGYAFILAGEARLYADEQFEWWYGDDDLERRAGVVVKSVRTSVEHRHPNSTTVGVLADRAAEDRLRYERKWAS